MDKEEFLVVAMKLLQTYIEEDETIALELLQADGVDEDDIQSVLYTIRSMSYGNV